MSQSDRYDLSGARGAENFRELEPGVLLALVDGTVVRVLENAGNGAVVLATVVEDPTSPDRVGEEEIVMFSDVTGVVEARPDAPDAPHD
jgi:hypothetical protein